MQRQENDHARIVSAVVSAKGSSETVEVGTAIARSWNRCVHNFGMDPVRDEPVIVVDNSELKERKEALDSLRRIAQGEMATLYQQLAGSGFSVLLTDHEGVVLNFLGDPSFSNTPYQGGMVEGAQWGEKYQGTNGMGTCAIEQCPILVHHNEHFLAKNVGLTCSAAPIFDHDGKLMAVLDASSFSHMAQQHTLVLVNMSAQTIENRLFLQNFNQSYALRFHSRPEFIGTLWEGVLALDEDGKVLAANRSALFQLGLKKQENLIGQHIRDLFNTGMAALLGRNSQGWLNPIPLYETRQGSRFFGLVCSPEKRRVQTTESAYHFLSEVPAKTGANIIGLDDLQFGDPTMEYNVQCIKRILKSDIPILLSGETGTGKEVFAQAIHHENSDGKRPFVAINCASIPETLIESELFGYKSGAFTGASRDGRRGKIIQANGGTLFLDEIGDMPLMLQARLLRVLEEREVTPLGSEVPIKVDIKLISATHRNLKELVSEGRFREDLYYRLQGVTISLPPLRERVDKVAFINHILRIERGDRQEIGLSNGALRQLETYHWPGNIRQLRNVLRTALALSEGHDITIYDLPDEVRQLEELSEGVETDSEPQLSALEMAEREAILQSLEKFRWNVTLAARNLKISRNTLYRKMNNLNIRISKEE